MRTVYTRLSLLWAALLVLYCNVCPAATPDGRLPERVSVLPVALVPQGEKPPTAQQLQALRRHLKLAQQEFRKQLAGRSTFSLEDKHVVYRAKRPLPFYRDLPKGEPAAHWAGELFEHLDIDRFNCPYILVVMVMNPADRFPLEGARPINGGYNTGGGILVLSSYALDRLPNLQSTLQHELGHAFGLPHVDAYGYDMQTNRSLMSYNPAHKTQGFRLSATPGELIPEDVRGLALNRRALPDLRFDPARDVPAGYDIHARVVPLGPLEIPGQPSWQIRAASPNGALFASKVENVVRGPIEPSVGPGVRFNANTMWLAQADDAGWTSVELEFPISVTLDRILVHSEHSGRYNRAQRVRVQAHRGGEFEQLAEAELRAADGSVQFAEVRSPHWRVSFRAGDSGRVVIRGLRFFHGAAELFPPLVPPADANPQAADALSRQ